MNRQENVYAYEFEGRRYDVGEVSGFVKTTLDFAMQDPKLHADILDYMKNLIAQQEQQ
jgi:UTP--glucose-1-phosphate uridylyltransferase